MTITIYLIITIKTLMMSIFLRIVVVNLYNNNNKKIKNNNMMNTNVSKSNY